MRKNLRILRVCFWVLCVLWVAFIFANSLKPGNESGQMSSSATEMINGALHLISPSLNVSHLFVRKAAHFSEFALLAWLLCFAWWSSFILSIEKRVSLKRLSIVLCAFPCSVAVAAADETIQLFVAGRVGAVTDVLIDSAGAACATLIFFLVVVLINRKKSKEMI